MLLILYKEKNKGIPSSLDDIFFPFFALNVIKASYLELKKKKHLYHEHIKQQNRDCCSGSEGNNY